MFFVGLPMYIVHRKRFIFSLTLALLRTVFSSSSRAATPCAPTLPRVSTPVVPRGRAAPSYPLPHTVVRLLPCRTYTVVRMLLATGRVSSPACYSATGRTSSSTYSATAGRTSSRAPPLTPPSSAYSAAVGCCPPPSCVHRCHCRHRRREETPKS
uniref:Secreted protein n=1 Tax=Setaria viridis TaxID=4556 RepID=A0A4U6THX3_SETVI|nr:hypothetical protein SEVIR_8G090400v2 [Setaria viridis]